MTRCRDRRMDTDELVDEMVVASSVDVDKLVDEEVVIDRYAALDAALGRLTRTMLCARAISRRTESISSVPAKPESMPAVQEEDARPLRRSTSFFPKRVAAAVESRAANLPLRFAIRRSPKEGGTRPLSGRRYELLFSELRRRRIGA